MKRNIYSHKCIWGDTSSTVAVKPNSTLQALIERYQNGTHPVSALYELSRVLEFQLAFKETISPGKIPCLYFAFCAVIDGVEYRTGMGKNKKDAKARAAQLALKDLLPPP